MLLAGARVDYRVHYLDSPPLAKALRIIRVDADAQELGQGGEPDVGIVADCQTAFQQLTEAWLSGGYVDHAEWLAEARRRHHRFYSHWAGEPVRRGDTMTGARVVDALRAVISEEVLFLVDGGNIGQWAHMVLCRDRYPSGWLTCGASGVVGWGVPGAMAARLAFPDRPVLLLSGDGAVGFSIAEFASASRQGIPFVAVVADDRAWGIVVSGQRRAYGCTVASELGSIDYARVAEGLGAQGIRVERPEEIAGAVEWGFESGRPTLVHIPIAGGGPADVQTRPEMVSGESTARDLGEA
jgi:acetolactate synthase-1/2/3 large subunit